MPRRSAASLVSPVIPGQGRPPPPADLDAVEKRVWTAVVNALPEYWIDAAGQLVLRRLVAQAAIAERREAELRRLRALPNEDEAVAELAAAHSFNAKTVAYLLTQLRATPRSRLVSRAAGAAVEDTPVTRPWEIRAAIPPRSN